MGTDDDWARIATADAQVHNTQWDRMRETRLRKGEMQPTDGWDLIISDSAFRSISSQSALAEWWEEKCWMPLMSTRMPRMGNVPVQPAPLGYMDRLPGRLALDERAAARRVETRVTLREESPHQPAAGELAVTRPPGSPICANCKAVGHRWHDGTLQACPGGVPLKDMLAREAQAKAKA